MLFVLKDKSIFKWRIFTMDSYKSNIAITKLFDRFDTCFSNWIWYKDVIGDFANIERKNINMF